MGKKIKDEVKQLRLDPSRVLLTVWHRGRRPQKDFFSSDLPDLFISSHQHGMTQ